MLLVEVESGTAKVLRVKVIKSERIAYYKSAVDILDAFSRLL